LKYWKFDLTLCGVWTAATIALAFILNSQDGKEQRAWFSGTVTLNTIISILSMIIRSALIIPVTEALTEQKW
ncbi:hypothetical protein B0J11DRAFT_393133, partial [Dendryphion nanum]